MNHPANSPYIQWRKATTARGKKFEIGFLPNDTPKPKPKPKPTYPLTLPDFGIDMHWDVDRNGGEDNWKPTKPEIRDRAAITRYNLYDQKGETYRYILQFTNTAHYDYYFFDESGDSYENNTYRNGDHFVRYNSDRPTIIYIKGS
ncbi:hypothetical protein RSOL_196130, partial [Rhizoctonia solani AG-3 Rhs1AP]